MILDKIEEGGIEVMFSYFPVWEMFFSMHVIAQPDHHMGRRKWLQAVDKKNPRLTEEIRTLKDITAGWTLLIDIPAWDSFRQMEIPEDLVRIFKALASPARLKIVRLLLRDIHTIQELSGYLSISEAGVFKHLKALEDAGLVKKKRRGAYVEYHFQTEMIDFIPYTFYEIMG